MNMTKRVPALLLALLWTLALTACGTPAAGTTFWQDVRPPAATTQEPAVPPAAKPAEATEGPSAPAETQFPAAETEKPSAPTEIPTPTSPQTETEAPVPAVTEDGWYDSKEEVALYLHLYGHLPGNYVTKEEAGALGWTGGSVERYTGEGTALGGSYFGNYEGLLPKARGRTYTECDVGTVGTSSRGAKRLVYSNDGLIYYTGDHYESFELLYGEP